jgi:multiple antibiotic resistance protein
MLDLALIIQLFILINPLSSLPFLMAAYKKDVNVRRLSLHAVITAYFLAVSIAILGPFLFNIFGVTLDSFRIAGGIVLLLLALDTIKPPKEEAYEIGAMDSLVAILATPLLTGPATISFITIKSYEMSQMSLLMNISVAFLLVGIVFIAISYTIAKINIRMINIASKVLGLFLTAVAIEMIAKGMSGIILSFKRG